MRTKPISLPLVLALLALAPMTSSSAQIPEEFTNLQVLDKEITRPELIGVMRSFAGDLGVRCAHCHVGPDNLQGMDFATDEKPSKQTARQMLRMTKTLNQEWLQELPHHKAKAAEATEIRCYNCHRGQLAPPTHARDLLLTVVTESGVEAGMAELERLDGEFAGAGVYDLSSRNLASVGRRLQENGDTETGVAWIEAVAKARPRDAYLPANLGWMHLQNRDVEAATQSFARALELDPENELAVMGKQRVDAIQSQQ